VPYPISSSNLYASTSALRIFSCEAYSHRAWLEVSIDCTVPPCGAAMRAAALAWRITRRRPLTTCSQKVHAESSLQLSRQIIDSLRKANGPLFVAVDEKAVDATVIPLTGCALGGVRRHRLAWNSAVDSDVSRDSDCARWAVRHQCARREQRQVAGFRVVLLPRFSSEHLLQRELRRVPHISSSCETMCVCVCIERRSR